MFGLVSMSLSGQTVVQQFKAETPAAFGGVSGRVVLTGEQFVSTNDSKPEASFSGARRDIQGVT
jgi:hypothetical protein